MASWAQWLHQQKALQKSDLHPNVAGNLYQEAGRETENNHELKLPDNGASRMRVRVSRSSNLVSFWWARSLPRHLVEAGDSRQSYQLTKMCISSPVTRQDAKSSVRSTIPVHKTVSATLLLESQSQCCSSAIEAPDVVVWEGRESSFSSTNWC